MDKFKIGDKVEVVEKYNEYKVGEVGIITSTNHTYYRINGDTWGALGHYFKKVEYKPMFKIGDKVKVTKRAGYFGLHSLDIGGVYEISEEYTHNGFRLKAVGKSIDSVYNFVHKDEIEMYQDFEYEDQWHLNDGKVEIPGDADKLEKDGSVVAFRKRKTKLFEFGEKLRIKKSLWLGLAKVEKVNPGFDYVNAVYLSKYFNFDNEEGIKVYIDNGEKGWECCLLDLSKVERLT